MVPISSGVVWVKFQLFDVFFQTFYMVAYVTKAGLGPEYILLSRSFFRWSRLIQPQALRVSAPAVLFIVSVAATQLASPSVTRPAVQDGSLDKVFEDAKIWTAVFMICFIIFFQNTHRKYDWVKNQANRPRNK